MDDSVAAIDESESVGLADDALEGLSRTTQLKLNLARELHDQVAQNLAAVLVSMELMKSEHAGRAGVQEQLSGFQHSVRQTLNSIRELLLTLRDMPQQESDFFADVRAQILAFERDTGIDVWLHVSRQWPALLPSRGAHHLRRILQEALRNVRQHSGATRVRVTFRRSTQGRLLLTVADNGRGFERAELTGTATLGFLGLRERAALLGGSLAISSRPGAGTTIQISLEDERIHAPDDELTAV